jgi:hypothetical protein
MSLLDVLRSTVNTLVVPTVLLTAFACKGYASVAHWASWLLGLGAYVAFVYLTGDWFLIGYYLRFALLAGYAIATAVSAIGLQALPLILPFELRHLVGILLLALFAPLAIIAMKGRRCPGEAVKAIFPLRGGIYCIAAGGSNALLNHHYPARYARFAIDIVKLNRYGFRAYGFYPRDLTKYLAFGETVISPIEGTIAKAVDGIPDSVPPRLDTENPAGNYVMIKHHSTGALIFLAHLQQGSLLVREGQLVCARQAIGRVGNSGLSTEPHLHVSCEVDEIQEYNLDGEGLPLLLDGKFLYRNNLMRSQ